MDIAIANLQSSLNSALSCNQSALGASDEETAESSECRQQIQMKLKSVEARLAELQRKIDQQKL